MKKAIVIHSDILGFKKIIENAENDKEDETLHKLQTTLKESVGIVSMFKVLEQPTKVKINYKLFSDNLYASFSYEEGDLQSFSDAFIFAVIFARSYFANMLDNKILVRGGISFGNDYQDETMIFSMALVKAYTIESKKAIYPRIVIDNELIDLVKQKLQVVSIHIFNILNNSLLKDKEGIYFINPNGLAIDFNVEADRIKDIAIDKSFIEKYVKFINDETKNIDIETDEGEKIAQKYEWLKQLLLWNYNDRKTAPCNDTFSPLSFKRE